MNRNFKNLFILSIIAIVILICSLAKGILASHNYQEYLIDEIKFQEIIQDKEENKQLVFNDLTFNDSIILTSNNGEYYFYSLINGDSLNNNPIIKTNNNLKVAFVTDNKQLLNEENITMLIYNETQFRQVTLVCTNNPVISLTDNDVKIIDNGYDSIRRYITSKSEINFYPNERLEIVFIQKSLGNNKRKNTLTLFSKKLQSLLLIPVKQPQASLQHALLIINDQFKGLYRINL